MATELQELRQLIGQYVGQQVQRIAAQRHWEMSPNSLNRANPQGGGTGTLEAQQVATGYDGTSTTLPFTLDLSILGGPDILLGS